MRTAKIVAFVYAGALCATTALAQTADGDIWTEAQCRQVAERCIANFGSTPAAAECWTAAVGDHCPDGGSNDYPNPVPPCWGGRNPCVADPSPY